MHPLLTALLYLIAGGAYLLTLYLSLQGNTPDLSYSLRTCVVIAVALTPAVLCGGYCIEYLLRAYELRVHARTARGYVQRRDGQRTL